MFTKRKKERGGFETELKPEGEMMEEGRAFTQRLYGNQQVPLADEKKRGLSYEREKQGPSPLFILLPPIFFLSCSGGSAHPSGSGRKREREEKKGVTAKSSVPSSCRGERKRRPTKEGKRGGTEQRERECEREERDYGRG